MTGNPNEMFGTKTPSITSMWIHSASLRSSIAMSSAKWPKSAERTEGDMILGIIRLFLSVCCKFVQR